MVKKVIEKFGKKHYLLGIRKEDNAEIWLEEATWNCNWYWGFGYLVVFNDNMSDYIESTHFDSVFKFMTLDCFKNYFTETVLSDGEIWTLLENMKTLYTLRGYSDVLFHGGSFITDNDFKDLIKNDAECDRINKVLFPTILDSIYKLLGGE